MRYPAHLFTIEISFGPEIPLFFEHFHDAKVAGEILRSLKVKMFGANGQIQALKLWHQGRMISQYISTPPKPKWIHVPAPDSDGVRHIPPMTKGQRLMAAANAPKSKPAKPIAPAPKGLKL